MTTSKQSSYRKKVYNYHSNNKHFDDGDYNVTFIAADPDANYQSVNTHDKIPYVTTLIAVCAGAICMVAAYKKTH